MSTSGPWGWKACAFLCALSVAADAALASQLWLRCLAVILLMLLGAVCVLNPDVGSNGTKADHLANQNDHQIPEDDGLRDSTSREEVEVFEDAAGAPSGITAGGFASPSWRSYLCCGGGMRGMGELEEFAASPSTVGSSASAEGSSQHPKFCGLRLEVPTGQLPDLRRFSTSTPDGPQVPESWDKLLPYGEGERQECRELRRRLSGVQGPKDPITMLRYLRARKGRLEAAVTMYKEAMEWRRSTQLDSGFRDGSIDDRLHHQFSPYWPPTGLLGRDRDGDAIYWNRAGAADISNLVDAPVEFLKRHEVFTVCRLVQALEEASHKEDRPLMYMTVVVDCSEVSFRHLSAAAAVKYKQLVRICEDNYPEMVKRVLIIRAPWFFNRAWVIVSRFFDEGTRNKFSVVDTANTYTALAKVMDEQWIPKELGGPNHLGGHPFCFPVIPKGGTAPRRLLEEIHEAFPGK